MGLHALERAKPAHPRNALDVDASRAELAERVAGLCRLTGTFTLRSGQTASTYFDKYLFESDPGTLSAVAAQMAPLVPSDTEVLAGLELGGIPVATALSLVTGLPLSFVRKEPKTYGTAKLAEGAAIDGKRVLVVEDVITTGGQVVASADDLRNRGALIDSVLCVIDRSGGEHRTLANASLSVTALFTALDLGG